MDASMTSIGKRKKNQEKMKKTRKSKGQNNIEEERKAK